MDGFSVMSTIIGLFLMMGHKDVST